MRHCQPPPARARRLANSALLELVVCVAPLPGSAGFTRQHAHSTYGCWRMRAPGSPPVLPRCWHLYQRTQTIGTAPLSPASSGRSSTPVRHSTAQHSTAKSGRYQITLFIDELRSFRCNFQICMRVKQRRSPWKPRAYLVCCHSCCRATACYSCHVARPAHALRGSTSARKI